MDCWTIYRLDLLAKFVSETKSAGLLCGLAGAVENRKISMHLSLLDAIIWFDSALCDQQIRTHRLNPQLAKRYSAN